MTRFVEQRNFLKTDFKMFKTIQTDAAKRIAQPIAEKPIEAGAKLISLPEIQEKESVESILSVPSIYDCIKNRRSVRKYSDKLLCMEELSFLLWATQGMNGKNSAGKDLRTVPSAGMTHTLESYLLIRNVEGLAQGVYRYKPSGHQLILMRESAEIGMDMDELTMAKSQPFLPYFAGKANVIFVWSSVPYRAEWKFDIQAHKKILIDVGHVCQNLYLASESIGAGTCAIGIYDQEKLDDFLCLNPEEEMLIYLAAVGKK